MRVPIIFAPSRSIAKLIMIALNDFAIPVFDPSDRWQNHRKERFAIVSKFQI